MKVFGKLLIMCAAAYGASACASSPSLYITDSNGSVEFRGIYYYTGNIIAPYGLITNINNDESVVNRIIIAQYDIHPNKRIYHGHIIRGVGRVVKYCDFMNLAPDECPNSPPEDVLIIDLWVRDGFYNFRRRMF